MKIIAYEASM